MKNQLKTLDKTNGQALSSRSLAVSQRVSFATLRHPYEIKGLRVAYVSIKIDCAAELHSAIFIATKQPVVVVCKWPKFASHHPI